MIDRYKNKNIANIWSEHNKLSLFTKIEKGVLREKAMELYSDNRKKMYALIRIIDRIEPPNLTQCKYFEKETKHDIEGFLEALLNKYPRFNFIHQYLHYGLTSSDLVDTANSIMIRDSMNVVEQLREELIHALNQVIKKYGDVKTVARTHGKIAEPQTLKAKFLRYLGRVEQCYCSQPFSFAKISGPIGENTKISKRTESRVLEGLGLFRFQNKVCSQIIPREHFLRRVSDVVILCSICENIATDLRLMSMRGEFNESFGEKQVGSSSMPHKRNPITLEKICGMNRLVKAYYRCMIDNIPTWEERDISHSCVDRVVFPDFFHASTHVISELTRVLNTCVFEKAVLETNRLFAELNSLFSHERMHNLVDSGLDRSEAYNNVKNDMQKELVDK